MTRDLTALTEEELDQLYDSGEIDPIYIEGEHRRRTYRSTRRVTWTCLDCGKEVGRDDEFVRRYNGEPWIDPFKPADGGEALFKSVHAAFCKEKPWWRRPRYKVTVEELA